MVDDFSGREEALHDILILCRHAIIPKFTEPYTLPVRLLFQSPCLVVVLVISTPLLKRTNTKSLHSVNANDVDGKSEAGTPVNDCCPSIPYFSGRKKY